MYYYGIVTETEPETCRARVHLEAEDIVTKLLPVAQLGARVDSAYWLPDVGEQVALLMDEHAEEGVILGALHNEEDMPAAPVQAAGERALVVRRAGAEVYRFTVSRDNDGAASVRAKSSLTAETTAGNIEARSGADLALSSAGALSAEAGAAAELSAGADFDITCGGLFTLDAAGKVKLAGNGEDLGAVITAIWAKFIAHKHVCAAPGQPTPTFFPPTAPATDYAPITLQISNLFQ